MKGLSTLIAASMLSAGALAQEQPQPFTDSLGQSGVKITENGRHIAYRTSDLAIYDQKTEETEEHPVAIGRAQGSNFNLSDEGDHLVYGQTTNASYGYQDVFLQNLNTGEKTKISVPNDSDEAASGTSYRPDISRSGDYIVFASTVDNLTDTERSGGVYMYEKRTGDISFVGGNYSTAGTSTPDVTPDGRWVLYDSSLRYTPSVIVNTQSGEVTEIKSKTGLVAPDNVHSELSNDGRFALIQETYDGGPQALQLYDRKTGTSSFISVSSDGSKDPVIVPNPSNGRPKFAMSGNETVEKPDYGPALHSLPACSFHQPARWFVYLPILIADPVDRQPA